MMRKIILLIGAVILSIAFSSEVFAQETPTVVITFDDPAEEYIFVQGTDYYGAPVTLGQVASVDGDNAGKSSFYVSSAMGVSFAVTVLIPLPAQCASVTRVKYDGYAYADPALYDARYAIPTANGIQFLDQYEDFSPEEYNDHVVGIWAAGWNFGTGTWRNRDRMIGSNARAVAIYLSHGRLNHVAGQPVTETYLTLALDNIEIYCDEELLADFTADPTEGQAPLEVTFTNTSINATSYLWEFGDGNVSTATNVIHTYTEPGIYTVTLTAYDGADSDIAEQIIYVTDQDPFYKPLRPDATGAWGIFDFATVGGVSGASIDPDPNTVIAISASAGENVYSVSPGTVFDVDLIQSCSYPFYWGDIDVGECYLKIPEEVGGDDIRIFRVSTDSLYLVSVLIAGDRIIQYVVTDMQVAIGDEISAGCIIGKTAEFYNLVGLELDAIGAIFEGESIISPDTDPIDAGVAYITMSDGSTTQPLLQLLLTDPTSLTPCNADPRYRACAGDAELKNPAAWQTSGGVLWATGQKPVLQPYASMAQTLNLSSDKPYSMTVQVSQISGAGAITMRLGTTTLDQNVDSVLGEYVIASDFHQPDSGLVYTASVTNTGSTPLEILSICVAESTPDQAPATCYFANPSFMDGLSGWTAAGGASTETIIGGEILMPDGSTIMQPATLYPNGAESYAYSLLIKSKLWWGYLDNGALADALLEDAEVNFEFQYPSGGTWEDLTAPSSSTTAEFSEFIYWLDQNRDITSGEGYMTFEGLVNVDSVTDSLLTIRANVTNVPEGYDAKVIVTEVCIDDPFSQWTEDMGGIDLPFNATCNRISPPTGSDFGAWIFFHWQNLDRFFQCDLMKMLNRMFTVGYDTLAFLRWTTLYWQSTLVSYNNWLFTSLVPWLNGHFANIVRASLNTTSAPIGTGASFWDVLYALITQVLGPWTSTLTSILGQAAALLLDIISRLLGITFTVIGMLLGLFGYAQALLNALVNLWNNAAPADISWLPSCTVDPKASAFCIGSWMLENTVLGGSVGVVIIPLLIGIQAVDLILWAIEELRGGILDSAKVS